MSLVRFAVGGLRRLIRGFRTRLYVQLMKQPERVQRALDLLAARRRSIPFISHEHLGILNWAFCRYGNAVSHFEMAGDRLTNRGRSSYVRSLFRLGDFSRVHSESAKLDTSTGYEYSAYSNIYFANWNSAARDLRELVRLDPSAHRPHINLAARDAPHYAPTFIDKVLAPDSLIFDRANFVGESLTHIGLGAQSIRLYGDALRAQHDMRSNAPKTPTTEVTLRQYGIDLTECRTFGPEWTAQIGHIGMIDLALKMRDMGWWSGRPVFLARLDAIANRLFFRLLTNEHAVVYEEDEVAPDLWANLRSLQRMVSFPFNAFEDGNGQIHSWNEAGALLTRAWRGGCPLRSSFDTWLSRSDRFQLTASRMRKEFGIDDAGWHVCLHVRDDGFHKDQDQRHRNASLHAYLDIVKLVRERGGVVIRMGAPSAPSAPEIEGLVDYAHSQWKSEEMDIYLMRTARCFIGSVSGMSNLAVSLDLPSAFVNSISYDAQMWHAKARFIPKSVYTDDGRILSQRELSSERWRWHLFGSDTMERAGLHSKDNSPDEIREIVLELLQDCDSMNFGTSTGIIRDWEESLVMPHYYGGARPSAYYLEKHKHTFLRDVKGLDRSEKVA